MCRNVSSCLSPPAFQFFAEVERRSGFAPNEIFFIDDKIDNVEAAHNRRWRAALWTGKSTLEELLESAAQLPPLA
jgi:putative hydrolase of the HAD superfamily